MNSFRKAISTVLTAVFMVQILSSSVIAESPPNKMVNDTGVLQSDQKSTNDKLVSDSQAVHNTVSAVEVMPPMVITPTAATPTAITPPQITSSSVSLINSMPSQTESFALQSQKRADKEREKTELIVKYKDGGKAQDIKKKVKDKLKLSKLNKKRSIKNKNNTEIIEISESDNIGKVVDELKKNPDIEYAQPNYKLDSMEVTDPGFNEQWGLYNNGSSGRTSVDIDVYKAWDISDGSNVTVGVLDSAVDVSHQDLKDNIDPNGYDFANDDATVYDNNPLDVHGTEVSGVIASETNGLGIVGAAPKTKILPLKFMNGTSGYTSDAIEGIQFAKSKGVRVINCSFGSSGYNQALYDAMKDSGIIFVCSAGNSGTDVAASSVYPACFDLPNIISVASIDSRGALSSTSSYGSKISVAAPGVGISTTLPGNSYGRFSGTSAAAPFVTGIVALLMSKYPDMSNDEIISRIESNVVKCSNLEGKVASGGRVDAYAALTNVQPEPDNTLPAVNNPGGQTPVYDSVYGDVYKLNALGDNALINEQLHYGESGIDPVSGNFSFTCTDLVINNPGFSYNIGRVYNSKQGWTYSYSGGISQLDYNIFQVSTPDSKSYIFYGDQTHGFYPGNSRNTLTYLGIGYDNFPNILTYPEEYELFELKTKDNMRYGFKRYLGCPLYHASCLSYITDRNGNTMSIEVEGTQSNSQIYVNVKGISDSAGRHITILDNAEGKTITDDTTQRKVTYHYAPYSYSISDVVDPEGNKMYYFYCPYGQMTNIKDNYSKDILNLEYYTTYSTTCELLNDGTLNSNYNYKLKSITNSLGNKETYDYRIVDDPDALQNAYSYGLPGRTVITDSQNRSNIFWYNLSSATCGNDYIYKTQDEEGKYSYSEEGMPGEITSQTDRNNNKTIYDRDSNGNITKITNPDLSYKEFIYDSNNNVTKSIDEERNYIEYTYDSNSNLIRKASLKRSLTSSETISNFSYTDAMRSQFAVTTYSYFTEAERTQNGYKVKGLLKSMTDPDGNTTTYSYDSEGNLTNEVAPQSADSSANRTTINTYDTSRVLSTTKTPEGFTTTFYHDKNNLPTKAVLNNGETSRTVYDALGRKTKEISPKQYNPADDTTPGTYAGDYGTRYIYYDNSNSSGGGGKLKEVIDAENNHTTYTYDKYGNVLTITKPNGSVTEYEYDVMNRPTNLYHRDTATSARVPLEMYSYNILSDGRTQKTVRKYIDDTGIITTIYTYDYAGRLVYQQFPNSTHISCAYYKNGKLKTTTDQDNYSTAYYYDGMNRLIEEDIPFENVNGAICYTCKQHVYDDAGNIIKEFVNINKPGEPASAATWKQTDYAYNCRNQLVKVTEYNNSTPAIYTQYFYDGDGNKIRMYTGLSQPLTINGLDNVTSTGDSEYTITKYQYNHMKKLTKVSTQKSTVMKMSASAANEQHYAYQRITMNRSMQPVTISARSKADNVVGTKNSDYSLYIDVNYTDGTNLFCQTANFNTGTHDWENSTYTFTPTKQVQYINVYVMFRNKTGTVWFDDISVREGGTGQNLVTSSWSWTGTDPIYDIKLNSYDTSLISPDCPGQQYAYQAISINRTMQPVTISAKSRATNVSGSVNSDYSLYVDVHYTDGTLQAQTINFNSGSHDWQTLSYTFTPTKTVANLSVFAMFRNRTGSVCFEDISVREGTGPNLLTTAWKDPLGRAINVFEDKVSYFYDKNGNPVNQVDRNGNILSMSYDNLDRLLTKSAVSSDTASNASYSYTYDSMGNKATMSGGGISTTYGYNQRGFLTSETESNGITKTYYYFRGGLRSAFQLTLNGSQKTYLTYNYDAMERLEYIYDNGSLLATYGYNSKGNRNGLTYANGDSTSYTYNLANKLKTLYNKKGSTVLSSYEYTYYMNGNQASKTDTTGLTTYAYDGLGRLATVNEPGSVTTAYQYDDYNNRNKMVVTGGTSPCAITYGYDSLNRLKTEINSVSGTTNYRYDDNGNQISKNNDTYKYDAFNQMTGFTSGTNTATYTYNADGLRTGKTVNGVTTSHTWDGDQIVLDFSGSNVIGMYTRGINLIAEDISGVRKYALFNGHGDLTGLCDTSGNFVKSYDYDAFGNEKSPDANDTNPFRYCGEYFDKETGDVYLRARYYNPADGRFISEDSYLGKDSDPLSLNLYTYCGNDPIDMLDPTGHKVTEQDKIDFKNKPLVINAINDLTKSYESATSDIQRQSIHELADLVRKVGRDIRFTIRSATFRKLGVFNGVDLNNTETILCISNPYDAYKVKNTKDEAMSATKSRFGNIDDNTNSNAFRHAYWNALMAKEIGINKAKYFADAHEFGYNNNLSESRVSTEMDLFNNDAGRYQGSVNSNKSYKEIADIIQERVTAGGLKRCMVNGAKLDHTVLTNSDIE